MNGYTGGDPGADTREEWSPVLAVTRVRALHGECHARCGWCHECGSKIPCATLRALDEPIPPRIQHPHGER